MASTTPLVFAWEPEPKGLTPESFNWELYDLHKDFWQGADLAKAEPEKLKQMEELWWAEAGRNNALPLNFSPMATVRAVFEKPSLTRGRSHFVYHQGTVKIHEGTAQAFKNTSYTINAKLNVPEGGADGVVVTQGGRFAGWGLVVLDGKPVWAYKNTQQPSDGIRIAGPNKLTPGDHVLTVEFAYDGKKGEFGKGGAYVLKVDGTEVARTTIDHTVPFIYSVDETLDIGEDRGRPSSKITWIGCRSNTAARSRKWTSTWQAETRPRPSPTSTANKQSQRRSICSKLSFVPSPWRFALACPSPVRPAPPSWTASTAPAPRPSMSRRSNSPNTLRRLQLLLVSQWLARARLVSMRLRVPHRLRLGRRLRLERLARRRLSRRRGGGARRRLRGGAVVRGGGYRGGGVAVRGGGYRGGGGRRR